jgi:hypothetical protein
VVNLAGPKTWVLEVAMGGLRSDLPVRFNAHSSGEVHDGFWCRATRSDGRSH